MQLRTLLILFLLLCSLSGCRSMGWGRNAKDTPEPEPPVANFSNSAPKSEDREQELGVPSGVFSKTNGRTEDPGTGLSSRSRDIEHNLGYQ